MVEYNENNRFPFHTGSKSVAICSDDHEDLYELDVIFSQVVERFPNLDPVPFYRGIDDIQKMGERDRPRLLKDATDKLLKSIKLCLMDEEFVHQLY